MILVVSSTVGRAIEGSPRGEWVGDGLCRSSSGFQEVIPYPLLVVLIC